MQYKIKKGDTLSQIAVDFDTTVDLIMLSNSHIKNRDFIREGDTIDVPTKTPKGLIRGMWDAYVGVIQNIMNKFSGK